MTTSSLQRLLIAFLLVCAAASAADPSHNHRDWEDHQNGNLVSIGHDSTLAAGEHAESVVSIFGSSTSAGEVVTVVSIFGDTKVTGTALDAAVAVFGNTTIDGKVDGDAVAVLGNVELGPHAEIGGNVVSVLGIVRRDPAAIVHGGVHNIFGADFGGFSGLRTWITHCLLYGRPLALVSGIDWAWGLALGFLAFYVCLALLCRPAIERCVQTFERQPGQTLVAAIVAMLLWPVLLVLLCVTVIGIAAVPFVMAAILCAVLFGKAVMLAWIGGRITGPAAPQFGHPAFAVLVGGAVVLALYVVPVLGFLVSTGAAAVLLLVGLVTLVYWQYQTQQQLTQVQKTQQQVLSLLQAPPLAANTPPSAFETTSPMTAAVAPLAATTKAPTVVRSETEAVDYGEVPLSGARLERLRALTDALRSQAFKGTLRVEVFTGDFCLQGNATDGYRVAEDEVAIKRCDLLGNPFADALTVPLLMVKVAAFWTVNE